MIDEIGETDKVNIDVAVQYIYSSCDIPDLVITINNKDYYATWKNFESSFNSHTSSWFDNDASHAYLSTTIKATVDQYCSEYSCLDKKLELLNKFSDLVNRIKKL